MVPDDPTSASGVWELPTPKSVSQEGRGQQGEPRCFLLSSGIGSPALRWGLLPSIAQEGQRCYPRKDGGGAVWPARLGNLRVQEGPFLHHLEGIHWSAPGTSQSDAGKGGAGQGPCVTSGLPSMGRGHGGPARICTVMAGHRLQSSSFFLAERTR